MDPQTIGDIKVRINHEFQRFERSGAPPEDFTPLPDVSTQRYLSEDFFRLEQQHLWTRSWLLVAHADELRKVGDYVLWDRAGLPIVIVRGRDGRIRAFYNTCSHRGGPLVRQSSGNERVFVCKYHCWAFGLDGNLNHVPDEHEFIAIDKSRRGLKALRCETFGNWIFVNRDPSAMPLARFLGPLVDEWRDFEPQSLRFVTRYTYELRANWKIMMDAFLEVYHLKHIHPHTVDKAIDHRGATMDLFSNGHSRMIVPSKTGRAEYADIPPVEPLGDDPRMEVVRSCSVAYSMFPNIITPTSVVSFPFLVFWPIARDRTLFEVVFFTRGDNTDPQSPEWRQRIAAFNVILDEDNENLPWIQRSIDSGALQSIPLSYQERRIYHFHEYVDRAIGVENIPPGVSVEPRLYQR